jgi:hypothetical protein
MTDFQIIFLLGPSGVGKSHVTTLLMKQIPFLFMDIDIHHPFSHYGLRNEWNTFATKLDPLPLAAALRARIKAADATRALLSFPSRRVLTRKHIDAAAAVGIHSVLLWGPIHLCKKAALQRNDGRVTSDTRYDDANKFAFETYRSPEFDPIRIEMFRADGSRWPDEDLLNNIRRLLDAEQQGM